MKHVLLSAAVLSALLFTACSSEDPSGTETPDSSSGILKISANLDITTGGVAKRSLAPTAFENAATIGIFIDGTGYTPSARTFTYNGTTTWETETPIYLTGNTATVYGYYPSSLEPTIAAKTVPVTVLTTLSENAFNATNNSQVDYMYAVKTGETTQATVTKAAGSAELTFKHAMAQLTFVINKGSNFGGTGELTNISLTKSDPYTFPSGEGTMSLTNGAITTETSNQTLSLTDATGVVINAYNITPSATPIATVLVAPTYISTDGTTSGTGIVRLAVTIDGIVYGMTAATYLPVTTIAQWEAGKNYTYTVTVGGGELSITSVAIAPWETITGETIAVQ
jgi:hypothetical protein